jgi:pimeloyl-ACP methyl ester carboxylesterase
MAFFVLVHGGFMGGWSWKKIKTLLELQGHEVYTPTLTGLGDRSHLQNGSIDLNTHIQDIKNLIIYENLQNVTLVGHSYAGLIIAVIASELPERLAHVIYLDALVPDNGDSLFNLVDPSLAEFFKSSARDTGNGLCVPAFEIPEGGLIDKADVTWCNVRLTPQSLHSFEQKVYFNPATIRKISTAFIHCTQNNDATLQRMKIKAQDREMHYYEIRSNHFPMIDVPYALSDLLLAIIADNNAID